MRSATLNRSSHLVVCLAKPWRPSIDDVDSISRGGRAKVRGTGSRRIPHRLNAEERTLYDMAKKKGYVAVRGTGYRKFRHGNPLPNIYRQWCDARGQLCVVVEQDPEGRAGVDRLVVDLAPLRAEHTDQVEALLRDLAAEVGVRQVAYDERPLDALPFNILPPGEGDEEEEGHEGEEEDLLLAARLRSEGEASTSAAGHESSAVDGGSAGSGAAGGSAPAPASAPAPEVSEEVEALRQAVAAQAAAVRQLKEVQGLGNRDAAVQEAVRILVGLKTDLARAEAPLVATSSPPPSPPAEVPSATRPPAPLHTSVTATAATTADPFPPSSSSPVTSSSTSAAAQEAPGEAPVAAAAASLAAVRRSPLEHYYSLPIWQIHAVPLFFEGDRHAVKEFAGRAAARVADHVAPAGSKARERKQGGAHGESRQSRGQSKELVESRTS